jgi:hypothetical protein
MLRGIKLTAFAVCVFGTAALAGCADTIYPRLPSLTSNAGSLLTPTEQQKAIQDLTAEQKQHGSKAAEQIQRDE